MLKTKTILYAAAPAALVYYLTRSKGYSALAAATYLGVAYYMARRKLNVITIGDVVMGDPT